MEIFFKNNDPFVAVTILWSLYVSEGDQCAICNQFCNNVNNDKRKRSIYCIVKYRLKLLSLGNAKRERAIYVQ